MSWHKIAFLDEVAVLSDTVPDDVKKQSASAGSATEAARQDHKHNLDLSSSPLDELGVPTNPLNMNSQRITSVGAPSAQGDALPADANLRASDSTLLEGSTKSEVQDHSPKAHGLDAHDNPTGPVAFNQQQATGFVAEKVSGSLGAGTEGQVKYFLDDNHFYGYVE